MNIVELFQSAFHDDSAFADYFINGRGGFPVTIEKDGETVAVCVVTSRPLSFGASGLYGYRSATGAMVGGVCVREDLRGRGYGTALLKKTIDVCRDLGYAAIYLSPDSGKDSFYARLGFETVQYAKRFRTRRAQSAHFTAERVLPERRFYERVVSILNIASENKAAFLYGVKDAERLVKEADMADGMFFIKDRVGAIGLTVKDRETLSLVAFVSPGEDGFRLSGTLYRGEPIFQCCDCCVSDEETDPFIMRLCLKQKKEGAVDLPTRIFERY